MTRFGIALSIGLSFGTAAVYAQSAKTFNTPEEAARALISAAEVNNAEELSALIGPSAKNVLSSGDAAQDKKEREEFARLAHVKHELEPDPMNHDRMVLAIGTEDWPFPVPLVKKDDKWGFDASQGALEMKARRIGANELGAIETCARYVAAQTEYATQDRDKDGILEYAQRLMSSPGKQDGLYGEGPNNALITKRLAEAGMDGSNTTAKPYHGYYYRILKAQGPNAAEGAHNYMVKECMMGGFALVAWPAQYGVTGVHTFIVNQHGVVYEKDMGPQHPPVTSYDPDRTWTQVD